MTDHEFEKRWNEMIDEQAPELWDRIEMRLAMEAGQEQSADLKQQTVVPKQAEEGEKTGFFRRLKGFFFGGSSLRTAASLTCLAVIVTAIGGGLSGMGGSAAAKGVLSSPAMEAADYDSMVSAKEAAVENGAMAGGDEVWSAETSASQTSGTSEAAGQVPEQAERKLIRNVSISAETMDFDSLIEKIKTQTSQAGGYIESSSIDGNRYGGSIYSRRSANLTLRIPSDQTDAFLKTLEGESNIINQSENLTDVTLQYVDMESHIKALRTEEEQLLKLMEQAESTDDLIQIQSQLTNVRYQIESWQSQLNTYDNLVDYDTVELYVQEVKQESLTGEPTVWERIRSGLADNTAALLNGIGNLLIWLITMIPVFAVIFAVIFAIIGLMRKVRGRRRNK